MSSDSYGMRLKQIREKYGGIVKDTTSCLSTYDRTVVRPESKYYDKYSSTNKIQMNSMRKIDDESNVGGLGNAGRYTSIDLNSRDVKSKYDSSAYATTSNNFTTNNYSREERLREIQKIRSNFAKSRSKAIDDWEREVQKSRNKVSEKYNFTQIKKQNTYSFNPEEVLSSKKNYEQKQNTRHRATSSYAGYPTQVDSLKDKLKRNYDYSALQKGKQIKPYEFKHQKSLRSLTNDYDKQNTKKSIVQEMGYGGYSKFGTFIQSQTTSPIKGLSKFDSVQKLKKVDFAQRSYDISKIDSIQDRIHKILGKK